MMELDKSAIGEGTPGYVKIDDVDISTLGLH